MSSEASNQEIYPIRETAPLKVDDANARRFASQFNGAFLLIDADNEFISQDNPDVAKKLSRIKPKLDVYPKPTLKEVPTILAGKPNGKMIIEAKRFKPIYVSLFTPADLWRKRLEEIDVDVQGEVVHGIRSPQYDEADKFFSEYLEQPAQLLRKGLPKVL